MALSIQDIFGGILLKTFRCWLWFFKLNPKLTDMNCSKFLLFWRNIIFFKRCGGSWKATKKLFFLIILTLAMKRLIWSSRLWFLSNYMFKQFPAFTRRYRIPGEYVNPHKMHSISCTVLDRICPVFGCTLQILINQPSQGCLFEENPFLASDTNV